MQNAIEKMVTRGWCSLTLSESHSDEPLPTMVNSDVGMAGSGNAGKTCFGLASIVQIWKTHCCISVISVYVVMDSLFCDKLVPRFPASHSGEKNQAEKNRESSENKPEPRFFPPPK